MRSFNYGVMQVDGGGGEPAPYKPKAQAVQSPGPSDLAKLSPQVPTPPKTTTPSIGGGGANISKQFSAYTGTSGFKPTERQIPGITKEQLAGGAADLLFGVGSFKSALDNVKEVFTGKNEQGESVNRLKSAGSVLGNTALGATNLLSTAAMVVPGVGAATKGGVVGLNAAVKGAKVANAANAASKVTPATSAAITKAVKAKNAAAEAVASTGTKVVSAGDVVLESAMKGAKFVEAQTKGKAASGLAAGVIALGPGAAGVSGAGKATTAITQSVNAAKKATHSADTFVPRAAKAPTKVTSGGSVPNVTKPAVAASGVKAGTSGKIAQAVTAAEAVSKVSPITNNPFYNNNPFNNTDNKTPSLGTDSFKTSKDTNKSQSQDTTNTSRVNQFKYGNTDQSKTTVNKTTQDNKGTEDGTGKKAETTDLTNTGKITKAGENDLNKTTEFTNNFQNPIIVPNLAEEVPNTPGEGDGPYLPPPPPPPIPVRVPTPPVNLNSEIEEVNRKRKWNPSAIV